MTSYKTSAWMDSIPIVIATKAPIVTFLSYPRRVITYMIVHAT